MQSLTVAVNGPLIVDDVKLLIRAAIDGVGLAFVNDERAAPLLREWGARAHARGLCPLFPGFFLYYPMQRQLPAAVQGAAGSSPAVPTAVALQPSTASWWRAVLSLG